jgi:hypothetical protein
MNKKTLIWIGVYGVVAYGAYYLLFSKTAYAKKIISNGASNATVNELLKFDMGYLRIWSDAAKSKYNSFTYKGKIYSTKGGRAVK